VPCTPVGRRARVRNGPQARESRGERITKSVGSRRGRGSGRAKKLRFLPGWKQLSHTCTRRRWRGHAGKSAARAKRGSAFSQSEGCMAKKQSLQGVLDRVGIGALLLWSRCL